MASCRTQPPDPERLLLQRSGCFWWFDSQDRVEYVMESCQDGTMRLDYICRADLPYVSLPLAGYLTRDFAV